MFFDKHADFWAEIWRRSRAFERRICQLWSETVPGLTKLERPNETGTELAISFRHVCKSNTRKFPRFTKITTHDLSDDSVRLVLSNFRCMRGIPEYFIYIHTVV